MDFDAAPIYRIWDSVSLPAAGGARWPNSEMNERTSLGVQGLESACQCRGHGFDPWSGKIPHAVGRNWAWVPQLPKPVCIRSNCRTTALISHASKECSEFSKPGFSSMWTVNFQMFKLVQGRGTRDQIANIHWIIKKTREFQKNIYFCFFGLCQSLWLCGSQ